MVAYSSVSTGGHPWVHLGHRVPIFPERRMLYPSRYPGSGIHRRKQQTITTPKPPVIWFPNLEQDCESVSTSGGGGGAFGAFSFLTMVVSVVNMVSLLVSNVNNNVNRNNNNDNLNNQNLQGTNENNNNNNANVLTQITFVGRKRREIVEIHETGRNNSWKQNSEQNGSYQDVSNDPETVVVMMAFDYISLLSATIQLQWRSPLNYTEQQQTECQLALLCQVENKHKTENILVSAVRDIFSSSYVEFLMPHLWMNHREISFCHGEPECPRDLEGAFLNVPETQEALIEMLQSIG